LRNKSVGIVKVLDNSGLHDNSVVKNYLTTDYEGMDNIMFCAHDIDIFVKTIKFA
jgi:hypothetical protein